MLDTAQPWRDLISSVATSVIEHADELTDLDRAIGDGDHGINMKRGCEEVLGKLDEICEKPVPQALQAVGMALVMKVGGASGPLYGTLFMSLGKVWAADTADARILAGAFATAIEAVQARGKSQAGEKTLLDVLIPVQRQLASGDADPASISAVAARAAQATVPLQATRGRAAFLGARSVGHMDPGARSSEIMITAICNALEADDG